MLPVAFILYHYITPLQGTSVSMKSLNPDFEKPSEKVKPSGDAASGGGVKLEVKNYQNTIHTQ